MHEVPLFVSIEEYGQVWYRGGSLGNVDVRVCRTPKGTGPFHSLLEPSDEICQWLADNTTSLVYIHEAQDAYRSSWEKPKPKSLVFGFSDAKDAVLFKLTWS